MPINIKASNYVKLKNSDHVIILTLISVIFTHVSTLQHGFQILSLFLHMSAD